MTFNESKHIYIDDGGRIVPSVTQILKPLSQRVYGDINDNILKAAAEKGTEVHKAIELFNSCGAVDIQEEYRGYLDAYIVWFEKNKVKPIYCEKMLKHNLLNYAGTIDMICQIGDKTYVVDFKTTTVLHDKIVLPQLMAYQEMAQDNGIVINDVLALQLRKEGIQNAHHYGFEEKKKAYDIFMSCLKIEKYLPKIEIDD